MSVAVGGFLLTVLVPRVSDTSGGQTPVLITTQTIHRVLAAADVQDAFGHEGLDTATYEVSFGVPAVGYPADAAGTGDMRVACLVFRDSSIAYHYVTTLRNRMPRVADVSRALRARNVAVLVDPAATPDDVRRTLNAVAQLRHG